MLKAKTKTTKINVANIPCFCRVGIDPQERKLGQRLLIDVSLDIDSTKLTKSDDINDTISYVDIFKIVQDVGQAKSYSLIEVLAEKLATSFLKNTLVIKVKLKVHKPHIPYEDFQGNVSVEVERSRE